MLTDRYVRQLLICSPAHRPFAAASSTIHATLLYLQVRAEFLDVTLAVLCFVAPDIEARLRQVSPGRGRAGAGQVAGAQQVFALADGQPENVNKVGT